MLFEAIHRRLSGSRQRPKPGSNPVQLQSYPRALHREAAPLNYTQPHGHRIKRRIGDQHGVYFGLWTFGAGGVSFFTDNVFFIITGSLWYKMKF